MKCSLIGEEESAAGAEVRHDDRGQGEAEDRLEVRQTQMTPRGSRGRAGRPSEVSGLGLCKDAVKLRNG